MSIADKLTTIATNAQKVNESNAELEYILEAQTVGRTLQANISDVAKDKASIEAAISKYGVSGFSDGPLDILPDGIDQVYAKGCEQGKVDFWDAIQKFGTRVRYTYAFDNWGHEYISPKYVVKPTSAAVYMFNGCSYLKRVDGSKFDFTAIPENFTTYNQGLYALFNGCSNLLEVDMEFQPTMSYSYFFASCKKLKTVKTIRVSEKSEFGGTTGGDCFYNCSALEDVVFEGVIAHSLSMAYCENLNRRTLLNISDCLKDFVAEGSTTTRTLVLHANAKAKLSDAEKVAITQKGWTLA